MTATCRRDFETTILGQFVGYRSNLDFRRLNIRFLKQLLLGTNEVILLYLHFLTSKRFWYYILLLKDICL